MAIRIVRLGTARVKDEGLRIGTVRRLPRGVPKDQYAARDFFDVWLPNIAPSDALLKWALSEPWTDARWKTFAKRYRSEMERPEARHLLETLAVLSREARFSVGCYCEDESRCHRRVLRELLEEHGAVLA